MLPGTTSKHIIRTKSFTQFTNTLKDTNLVKKRKLG